MLGTAIKNTILFLLIILILHFLINNVLVEKKILNNKNLVKNEEVKEESVQDDVVDDIPLSINNLLEIFWIVDPDLGIILLSLEFELNVQNCNHWILEFLWLLLETSVGESLLEGDSLDKERVSD